MGEPIEQFDSRLADADVRAECLFWLPAIAACPTREFRDFVEDDLMDAKDVLAALPMLRECVDASDPDEVLDALIWKKCGGFIAQLATPIPSRFFEGGYSCSWGHYQTQWFYFPTLDALVETAEAWVEQIVEAARKRERQAHEDDPTP